MRPKIVAATSAVLFAFALTGGSASALAAPKVDKASPNLIKNCVQGTHFKEVTLTA